MPCDFDRLSPPVGKAVGSDVGGGTEEVGGQTRRMRVDGRAGSEQHRLAHGCESCGGRWAIAEAGGVVAQRRCERSQCRPDRCGLLKRHQDRIRAGLADVNQKLAEHDEHDTGGRAFLHDSLRLLTDAHHAYARSGDADRRLANQAFYTRLDITDDEQLRPRLAEPFATIIREAHEHGNDEGKGRNTNTTNPRMSRVPVRHFGWTSVESLRTPAHT